METDNKCRYCGIYNNPDAYCKDCARERIMELYHQLGISKSDIEKILTKLYPDG